MSGELGTTNLLLGIMAAVSMLEALVIIGMGVAGFMAYRKVMVLVDGIETRQVAPARLSGSQPTHCRRGSPGVAPGSLAP